MTPPRRALAIAALLLSACTAEKLPTYSWVDVPTALRTISQHRSAWHTLSGTCTITLERYGGQNVRLDGAIALDAAGRLRLRAWKFNQAVFDLTLTPAGLWLVTSRETSLKLSAGGLGRALALFTGDVAAGAQVLDVTGSRMLLRTAGGALCDIDTATLTVRRYRIVDSTGAVRFTLTLDRYRDFSGIVWPTRIVADSPDGRITVDLGDVEINTDLAPGAFTPPARAEKQP